MSAGKLFHNRAPAVAKAQSPTVVHCDCGHPADVSVMTVGWRVRSADQFLIRLLLLLLFKLDQQNQLVLTAMRCSKC